MRQGCMDDIFSAACFEVGIDDFLPGRTRHRKKRFANQSMGVNYGTMAVNYG